MSVSDNMFSSEYMRSKIDMKLRDAMALLASVDKSLFIGQGVRYGGVATYNHLTAVPEHKRIEFPVAEELQLGMSIGLSLQGYLPISIFPRIDFLMRAMDQLVNHLDKLCDMSRWQFNPRVIIRTRVGSRYPLDAGPQHTQDHTYALTQMLQNVRVARISSPEFIIPVYETALRSDTSTIVIEALD